MTFHIAHVAKSLSPVELHMLHKDVLAAAGKPMFGAGLFEDDPQSNPTLDDVSLLAAESGHDLYHRILDDHDKGGNLAMKFAFRVNHMRHRRPTTNSELVKLHQRIVREMHRRLMDIPKEELTPVNMRAKLAEAPPRTFDIQPVERSYLDNISAL